MTGKAGAAMALMGLMALPTEKPPYEYIPLEPKLKKVRDKSGRKKPKPRRKR